MGSGMILRTTSNQTPAAEATHIVDSGKLEYGSGTLYAGFSSF